MNFKNTNKAISVSLIMSAVAIFGLVLGNANATSMAFAQQTTGQLTKGTIVQGEITAANLTNG